MRIAWRTIPTNTLIIYVHYNKRVAEAEERKNEKRERENDHHDVMDNAQTFKSLQGLHESESPISM